ncbi:hypothetical protein F0562_022339 [Nyssa sinensis]|uniref:Uncharacterized protein n=1 Tax=Nyssa sinensis TaxID=561372 RepID=A0A5J5BRI7_9ASTE|nr:hypothetical protein F0562_022339 [Nyssa sinensis]
MGVPSFYRWLANKYPDVVANAVEEREGSIDTSLPNPNGMEFDNLYLDMNGIIHPCFHPDDNDSPPTTFEEVFNHIFEYIDRLFNIVRPRKLLYMAIDGVAPRAKMNQQRARRFRTSKDNETAEAEEKRLRIQFEMEGKQVLPKQESEVSDSNIITPGTEFMYRLSQKLQSYICLRLDNDAGWKDLKVILSDANVPGEGEHKIMSFIRQQRTVPGYNPNTRHCLYGLDADLIMLALATHEIHFSILRENVFIQDQKPSCETALEYSLHEAESSSAKPEGCLKQVDTVNQNGSLIKKPCQDALMPELKSSCEPAPETSLRETVSSSAQSRGCSNLIKKPYQFLHVWILREYLEIDMEISDPPEKFEADVERFVDDFIFMCFFAGNDFLPHLPTLEIHEGAIDLLMHVYKKEFKNLGGYLVDMQRVDEKKRGYLKLKRVEKFILLIGTYEEKIFKKRSELQERKLRRMLSYYADAKDDEEEDLGSKVEHSTRNGNSALQNGEGPFSVNSATILVGNWPSSSRRQTTIADDSEILKNTKELKEKLKDQIRTMLDMVKNGGFKADKVRLGEAGWKERYYKEKFSADNPEDIKSIKKALVEKYTEGLCWVLQYYFSGVPSWTWYENFSELKLAKFLWCYCHAMYLLKYFKLKHYVRFYRYHYGPFASDFKGLTQVRVNFQKGLPFKPFDQLMGVLPPRSAHALPKAYQALMTDENSNIIDFYPTDFEVDVNGKRYMWQAICKLPFIEEERLLTETKILEKELKENEASRNAEIVDQLFVRCSSKLGTQILSLPKNQVSTKQSELIKIDSSLSEGVNGFLRHKDMDSNGVDSKDGNILCLYYELPNGSVHIPRLLEDVDIPVKTITEADIVESQLWHECQGGRPSNRKIEDSRLRIQDRKPTNRGRPTSTNSYSEVKWKGAGSGWGAGRGREYITAPDCRPHPGRSPCVNGDRVPLSSSSSGRELNGTSSSWGAGRGKEYTTALNWRGHNEYPRRSPGHGDTVQLPFSASAREVKGPNASWDTGVRGGHPITSTCEQKFKSGAFRGTHGFNSYGRAQSVNHNVWSSSNGSMPNMNYEWRPIAHSTAITPSNTSHAWQHNQYSAATTSMPVPGRGTYPAATASMPVHGRGTYPAATASMPVHGRGTYPAASASMPVHGRGTYPAAACLNAGEWERHIFSRRHLHASAWERPIRAENFSPYMEFEKLCKNYCH